MATASTSCDQDEINYYIKCLENSSDKDPESKAYGDYWSLGKNPDNSSNILYFQEKTGTQGEFFFPTSSLKQVEEFTDGVKNGIYWKTANANENKAVSEDRDRGSFGSDPEDPSNLLPEIEERRTQRQSVLPVSPLKPLHDITDAVKNDLYERTNIKLGFVFSHLFQGLTESLPETDQWGTATAIDLLGSWDLVNQGKPNQGKFVFHMQGRWDYGTTGPGSLGPVSLLSNPTANIFDAYDPPLVLRNLYWEQGSPDAGWAFRIGKITPDAILSSSQHLNATTTFITTAGTGSFSNALPDSGLGIVSAWYPSDRFKLVGLFSDANADRFDFGDIGEGDFFKAIEVGLKPFPKTPKSGYWKFTFWHTDGTSDGLGINGMTGVDGWGFFVKLEQELSDDGNAIAILRYGHGFNDSSIFRNLAGAHLLLYDPLGESGLQNDLVGLALNYAELTAPGARGEYNIETFYRFPLFPGVDTTLSYQFIINPALDRNNNNASAFSFRIRSVF
ncbi:MAG: carbohydrate porin [Xenococcus sp. (in: cyanobacteria)]